MASLHPTVAHSSMDDFMEMCSEMEAYRKCHRGNCIGGNDVVGLRVDIGIYTVRDDDPRKPGLARART